MKVCIASLVTLSALGVKNEAIWHNYCQQKPLFSLNHKQQHVSRLENTEKQAIKQLQASTKKYKKLDNTVLYALFTARKALQQSQWQTSDFGINMSSSRGATTLFEKYHTDYKQHKKLSSLVSPNTTLGNISSWLAHDLNSQGFVISHSITCSSAFAAIANACAWIKAGMSDKFMVGASEAPLTDFTIAQMQALGIYAKNTQQKYPCRALDFNKTQNSMVLAEATGIACLQKQQNKQTLALITGIGYGTEILSHNTSLSTDAKCLQKSMQMALANTKPSNIDIIVTHTPGTLLGDAAEHQAIKNIFGKKIPALTCNKWQVGHALAASGMLSLQMALFMLQKQKFIATPFYKPHNTPQKITHILINSVGFGGNAVSLLISTANQT